jgi:signal transduction histidine kinase
VIVTTGIVRRLEQLSEDGRRFLRGEPLAPKEPSADEIGRLTDNIVFMSGVLEQRRAEAVAATRAKNEFLWRIGHELRTPLTAIIGFGQLLEEEHLEPENLDSAQRIVSAGHHVLALIDELTDIAKIESGHITVSTEPITVHEVASETVVLVRSMASARSLALSADCPRHIVVIADRQRLTQVLINLLSNAVKYNRPDGRVHLAAVRTGATVRINVTDTGPGISDVDLDLLFRPYQRLGAEDSGIEGSGIGLALTKNLVEAMGGTIGVDTEVGRGTTFWIDLPAATTPPDATPDTATTTAASHSGR